MTGDEAEVCLPGPRQVGLVPTSKVAGGRRGGYRIHAGCMVWGRVRTRTFTLEEMGPLEGLAPRSDTAWPVLKGSHWLQCGEWMEVVMIEAGIRDQLARYLSFPDVGSGYILKKIPIGFDGIEGKARGCVF